MGLGIADVEYLSAKGYFAKAVPRLLDIGSQCLLNVTPEAVHRFVAKHGSVAPQAHLASEAERIAYFSTPRPGERTTYLSELLDLTPIEYTSFDVCPALKTEIFDLNVQALPPHYREHFDVVLNCGTTEHVINQMNCLRVMHDALAAGGVMLHTVPAAGYIGHGYFCYHEEFFRDFAAANEYVVDDLWYTPAGQCQLDPARVEVRAGPLKPASPVGTAIVPNFNISVALRKTVSAPLRAPLELSTAHSAAVSLEPSGNPRVAPDHPDARAIPGRLLLREVGFRVLRRLGLT